MKEARTKDITTTPINSSAPIIAPKYSIKVSMSIARYYSTPCKVI